MKTLRMFIEVAHHRSFSQAAKALDLTQSAVSQRVGQLEEKLGVQLLDRSTRPLSLTPAGEAFLQGSQDILQRYDQLEQRVILMQGQDPRQIEGTVKVDAIYSAGIDLLRRAKEAFEAEHPRIAVVVNYQRPDEIHDEVLQGRADLGIVSYPERFRGGGIIKLREETMAVICAPGHPLAERSGIHAGDLLGHRMVGFELTLPVGRRTQRYLREHGVTEPFTNVFDNLDTLKGAVSVTDQVAIVPKRTVLRDVAAGTLAVINLEPRLTRPVGVIYRRSPGRQMRQPLSPACQAFVDFLLEHAGNDSDLLDDQAVRGRELIGGEL